MNHRQQRWPKCFPVIGYRNMIHHANSKYNYIIYIYIYIYSLQKKRENTWKREQKMFFSFLSSPWTSAVPILPILPLHPASVNFLTKERLLDLYVGLMLLPFAMIKYLANVSIIYNIILPFWIKNISKISVQFNSEFLMSGLALGTGPGFLQNGNTRGYLCIVLKGNLLLKRTSSVMESFGMFLQIRLLIKVWFVYLYCFLI